MYPLLQICRSRWLYCSTGIFTLWLLVSSSALAQDKNALTIFVSVLPQKYLVERLGGEAVAVTAMVKPGHSPATYEPTPRQISKLAKAALYIRVGVPFEDSWMARIKAVNPEMIVLDVRDELELRRIEAHDHHHHGHKPPSLATEEDHAEPAQNTSADTTMNTAKQHDQRALDPHVWTSPRMMRVMAERIHQQLVQLSPQDADTFDTLYADLNTELKQLDTELSLLFADYAQRKFMVFHPSWGYLADAYQLIQVPLEIDGKEPGARALTQLIQQARAERINTLFVQPQFDKSMAEQAAQAISGKVVIIDPLAEDYVDNLRQVARLLVNSWAEQTTQ